MRTAATFRLALFMALFFAGPLTASAARDTLKTRLLATYWTKQRFVPKVGASVQDRALFELGIHWHHIYKHPLSLASKGPYATVDVLIDDQNLLLGPKLGYEFTAGVFGAAFDVTYYYDKDYDPEGNNRRAFVGTPKAGLTLLGFVNFFYGYQIPFSEQRITSLSRHRFSITFTLNKDYFDIKNAPRKL
jgi:hypothetical protein